jgi:superfamily II DNA/RNA helicase
VWAGDPHVRPWHEPHLTTYVLSVPRQEELRLPLARNEGPVGLILCPSRELARQTYEIITGYCEVGVQHEELKHVNWTEGSVFVPGSTIHHAYSTL